MLINQNKYKKAKKISDLIRKTFGIYPEMGGGCYKFHLILKETFPKCKCYYNSNHVITKIGCRFFDIHGEVKLNSKHNYLPISFYGGYSYLNKIFYKL